MAKALAQLNWLDALYWALLLFPIVFGMLRGFVRQIVPLVGLFVAFTLAGRYYPLVHAKLVGRAIESAQVGQAVSFGIVFLVVSIVFSLLSVGLDRLVKVAMLGWLNRSLGAAVGLLKGGVYVLILAYGVVMFAPRDKPAVKASRWTPAVVEFAETTLWPMI
ncbi:MAG: CvpA family protein, partial [Candidatus Methylomirabilis sp.]|nr:CvpA family protein [Deltaproteobacteria bacterium]